MFFIQQDHNNHIKMERQKTNTILDKLINGLEKDVITTVYGPAASGKTNICISSAVEIAKEGKKVIYIDTEGGFSVERLKQLVEDYENILDHILFFKPTSFEEQKNVFEKLNEIVNEKVGLVVVDSISMLYRLERKGEDMEINRELGRQLGVLNEICRKKNIPVIITNQVYANFDDKNKVNMVGGDILKYWSKCLIELSNFASGKRLAVVRKHRAMGEKELFFEIRQDGLFEVEANKFRLF